MTTRPAILGHGRFRVDIATVHAMSQRTDEWFRFITDRVACSSTVAVKHGHRRREHNDRQHRSLLSECLAFVYLDLTVQTIIAYEHELAQRHVGVKIPEGFFWNGTRVIGVEVKRITATTPRTSSQRWQWKKTVRSAIEKGESVLNDMYKTKEYVVVFILPSTLSMQKRIRTVNHLKKEVWECRNALLSMPKATFHVIVGTPDVFNSGDVAST